MLIESDRKEEIQLIGRDRNGGNTSASILGMGDAKRGFGLGCLQLTLLTSNT